MPTEFGQYRIIRKIGEGGMGVVYEALDQRLGRVVALKTVRTDACTADASERLWREARSLARVSHPNICQLFDAGREGGTLYLVLEFLEGQSLAERLKAGAIPAAEAVSIERQILTALEALHQCSIVHRDVKPSNVFLTPHGVKLLDFGLARGEAPEGGGAETVTNLTAAGAIVGTPCYMAPEQARGLSCGAAADIFSAGCVLYEMLAGARPFHGESSVDVLYSVLHHEPPSLAGSPQIEALDRVVRRALAKQIDDRWPTAAAMRAALATVEPLSAAAAPGGARGIRRLIALPFRALRKDDDAEFLSYSLPDAITNSLAGLDSVIVRSSLVAARFATQADPKRIAEEAHVDAILTGSFLRSGDRLRITCQLVEAPEGTVIWSDTTDTSMQDLFSAQDALVARIVELLLPPLTTREERAFRRDVPRGARAYEDFLRANQMATRLGLDNMRLARDLYRRCLEEDPQYAPAWAGLGRAYRWIQKFGDEPEQHLELAAEAFQHAFALNPDLACAHNLYTPTECDLGLAADAMIRLLARAHFRRHDADLFAGLVQACRYCGELTASVAAHVRARRIDPHIATSATHTYFLLGEYEKTIESYSAGRGFYLDCAALAGCGRDEEALERLRQRESAGGATGAVRGIMGSLRAYLEGDFAGCLRAIEASEGPSRRDPETLFYLARHLARIGEGSRAMAMLSSVVDHGFLCEPALERDPWLAPLHAEAGFQNLLNQVRQRRAEVHASFVSAGGEQILAAPL